MVHTARSMARAGIALSVRYFFSLFLHMPVDTRSPRREKRKCLTPGLCHHLPLVNTIIANSLILTQADEAPEDEQMMARVAKNRCLLCGEPVHDVQMWCRHIKQQHAAQHGKAQNLAESSALPQACIQRPCLWCKVHFQDSRSLLESIGRSARPYCSCVSTMTLAPMETTPEQQMAAVWGLSSPLAATPQKPVQSRRRQNGAAGQKEPRNGGGGGRNLDGPGLGWTRKPFAGSCEF